MFSALLEPIAEGTSLCSYRSASLWLAFLFQCEFAHECSSKTQASPLINPTLGLVYWVEVLEMTRCREISCVASCRYSLSFSNNLKLPFSRMTSGKTKFLAWFQWDAEGRAVLGVFPLWTPWINHRCVHSPENTCSLLMIYFLFPWPGIHIFSAELGEKCETIGKELLYLEDQLHMAIHSHDEDLIHILLILQVEHLLGYFVKKVLKNCTVFLCLSRWKPIDTPGI